jgi:hypothetical protein
MLAGWRKSTRMIQAMRNIWWHIGPWMFRAARNFQDLPGADREVVVPVVRLSHAG